MTDEPKCTDTAGHNWEQDDVSAGPGTILIIESHCTRCEMLRRERVVGEFPPDPNDKNSVRYLKVRQQ